MTIKRDAVLIVDIESTCWKDKKAPEDQRSEIIEIGICQYNLDNDTITNKAGILIQPTESSVSPFCTELTTITPDMLEKDGITFTDACQNLRSDYQSEQRLWLSWGNYDRRMFIEQCERRGIDYPFADQHCNLKNLFANLYGNRLGTIAAMNKIKLEFEGVNHRGIDDAYNIARILQFLVKTHGIDLLDSFWE